MSYKIRNKTTGEILINNVFYLLRENDGRMQVFEIFSAGSKHNKIDFETLLRTDLEVVFENEKILHGESRASSRLVEIERLAKENAELKNKIENLKIIEKKNRKIQNLQKRLKNKWEIIKNACEINIGGEPEYKRLQVLVNNLLAERKQLKSDVTNLCQENKSLLDRKNLIEQANELQSKVSRETSLNYMNLIKKLEAELKAKDKKLEQADKLYNELEKEMQSLKAGKIIERTETVGEISVTEKFKSETIIPTEIMQIDKFLAEMINSGQSEILKAILKKQYVA